MTDAELREKIDRLTDELQTWYDGDPSPTDINNIGDKLMSLIVTDRERVEKAARADELIRLSEWGKTIDAQWNNHFKERLAALKEIDSEVAEIELFKTRLARWCGQPVEAK